jgi:hypothetical protein
VKFDKQNLIVLHLGHFVFAALRQNAMTLTLHLDRKMWKACTTKICVRVEILLEQQSTVYPLLILYLLTCKNYTQTVMPSSKIPTTGTRSTLVPSIKQFLKENDTLHLGGDEDFHGERRKHLEVFGIHSIPKDKQHPIGEVEFTAVRGPHGTIPVRVLHPKSGEEKRKKGEAGALIYFHGGGYTVGTVDEFENGLRQVAEESGVQVGLQSPLSTSPDCEDNNKQRSTA